MDPNTAAQAGTGLIVLIGILVVWWVVAAIFLAIGAAITGIQGRSFGKAMLATLGMVLLSAILGVVLPSVGLPPLVAQLIGLLASVLVVKIIYGCGFVRALLAWLVSVVVSVIVVLVLAAVLGVSVAAAGGG